ncbi:hypothetical protein HY496_02105 [Candidatus Woesearchaeota archaeon]|nr:hypothetical protein [Candidatus Woesearchaeota archaeon]
MVVRKKVLVYTDFDETMITEDSAKIFAREMIRFYKKTFGWFFLPGFFSKTVYRYVLYKMTGKTDHFYKIFFYFDLEALDRVAEKLTINPRWAAMIEKIKRQEGNASIELIILSRNILSLIRRFVQRKDVQARLSALSCSVEEIIAHVDVLFGDQLAITVGVWRPDATVLLINKEGAIHRRVSRAELKKIAAMTVIPEEQYGAFIIHCINQNKQEFFRHGENAPFYYIGDKEDEYLSPAGVPKDRFYRV